MLLSCRCIEGSWPHFYHGILDSDDSLTGYTTAFYWVATTMSQTGYGDIHAHLIFEYILSILVMTIGFMVFNFSLISITAILLNSSYSKLVLIYCNCHDEFMIIRILVIRNCMFIHSFWLYHMCV